MAVILSVATMLILHAAGSVGAQEATCTRHSIDDAQNSQMEGCSLSMLQVDSKRQEYADRYASVLSQQQRAEVNSAMFELHATLRDHPKVAKQALHEVLLDMGVHGASKGKKNVVGDGFIDQNGHSVVAARRVGQPQPQPMPPMGQNILLKQKGLQPGQDAAAPTGGENSGEGAKGAENNNDVQAAPADRGQKGAMIAPFGKEDTASELTEHAERTQDTLVDAVENAEVAEVKRAVFRALTRLRAASIKEFDTIARLETQAIDEYNDAHHYRAENPLSYVHNNEPKVKEDKYTSFH